MPRPYEFHTQKQGSERLPLEGKLAQRQLRLMRSKLPIITIGWYDTVTFDLIRHAKRRDTFPSRGRLFLCPGGFCGDFYRSDIAAQRAGRAPPARISYAETAERCLPCVGGGGPRLRGSEGVYGSNLVGDHRMMACSKSIAYTPSVATNVATAPPTQGSLFLGPGRASADFLRSNIATQRARHTSPLPCHAGTFHRPYRAPPGDLRFSRISPPISTASAHS